MSVKHLSGRDRTFLWPPAHAGNLRLTLLGDFREMSTQTFHAPAVAPADRQAGLGAWLRSVRSNMLTAIPSDAWRAPVVSDRLGPLRWHALTAPGAFRHVFKDRLADYPKAPLMQRLLRPYVGDGLILADGENFHWQRRAMAPVFGNGALKAMQPAMQRVADATVARLLQGTNPVAMSFQMRVMAMDMVRHTMFSGLAEAVQGLRRDGADTLDPDRLDQWRAGHEADLDRFVQALGRPGIADLLNLPDWMRPMRLLGSPQIAQARRLIDGLIAQRRQSGVRHGDLLDLMLAARAPDGRAMNDAQIRNNIITFIIAGSDTTALAVTWAIYVLTQAPEWLAPLREEAAQAFDGQVHRPEKMRLTKAFLHEVMRLFPPAPMLIRRARVNDVIQGVPVRRGDMVLAPIYTLHRNPSVWADPLRFDPARFDADLPDRFAFMPFGAGPRVCIGAAFAMQEAQLTLATLVRDLDFQLAPGWSVTPLMMLTLKPDGGLPILVRPRGHVRKQAA